MRCDNQVAYGAAKGGGGLYGYEGIQGMNFFLTYRIEWEDLLFWHLWVDSG